MGMPEQKARQRRALLRRDGDICGICKRPLEGERSIDHIIARCNGGSNKLENLRLTHHSCNTVKNTLVDQYGVKP